MIASIVDDNDAVAGGMLAKGALPPLNVAGQHGDGHGAFCMRCSAPIKNARNFPHNFDPRRLIDVGDVGHWIKHSVHSPSLDTSERFGIGAETAANGKPVTWIKHSCFRQTEGSLRGRVS